MKNAICAISTGPETHLDHLAPICEALSIPLLVTEPDHEELAQLFYPMVEVRYAPLQDLHLKALAEWDTIITTCKFWALELRPTLELIQKKEVRFVFTPHGHSDKEDFINSPIEQDIDLVYGPAMKETRRNTDAIEMGNIRHPFYLKYQNHFDRLAAPFFKSDKQAVLYAPTWQSTGSPTSFFNSVDTVVEQLSKDYNLLIKLHPLLEENNPALYHRAIGRYGSQATFIERFPAIYPLLEKTAIYLGDHSSIGYDFLAYDRPMYFLSEGGALAKCGRPYRGRVDEDQKELSEMREARHAQVFKAPPLNGAELLTAISRRHNLDLL